MASSSNSPCAACKFLRRKCTQECVFAPYFPPDQPIKFANVHKVFGASNVAKILNDLPPTNREDTVKSLAYEAEARLRDPVYGCVGLISLLQHQLKHIQSDVTNAKKELANYIGPSAMLPVSHQQSLMYPQHSFQSQNPSSSMVPYGMPSVEMNMSPQEQAQAQLLLREQQQQQQMMEAQHLAALVAAREQHEMMRNYAQQQQVQQQQALDRFNSGFDGTTRVTEGDGVEFNQLSTAAITSSSLALVPLDNPFHVQQPQQEHPHHYPHPQQRDLNDEVNSLHLSS
ncbi:LOB domain-containing protein 36-like isoform X2 [Telopea speciosissima]|uniref:LOB domain-containing protein 36-like isoform X2 n=1 Tax=Telopea speciosissima TaxID=54955 RepID=UPI001CC706F1|nr:LOB domain-containing protein 36-like isoform X2 [Telopea speciosissima]